MKILDDVNISEIIAGNLSIDDLLALIQMSESIAHSDEEFNHQENSTNN